MNNPTRDNVKDWVRHAENDLIALRKLLDGGPWEVVCFHAQQAAEKMLKAYLIFRDVHPERTHDLSRLLAVCINYDASLGSLLDGCILLAPYAVASRYPDETDYDPEDAEGAAQAAEVIYMEIKKKILASDEEQAR